MNWIKNLFSKKKDNTKKVAVKCEKEGEQSLTIECDFIKKLEFEKIWISENVKGNYRASKFLSDNDYLDYHIWEDQNHGKMCEKYLPDTTVFRGENPNIIFHGGCLGCISQRKHGINRCIGCQYFKADWGKPNLHIEGEECATINEEDFKNMLKG